MICEVIMPAYNQQATLPRVIAALAVQELAAGDAVRLILVDDGSTDDTHAVAARACQSARLPCLVIPRPHQGVAAARNHALSHVTAEVVLLLGADIILRPAAVAQHLVLHKQKPSPRVAGLGMVRWDPRLPPTPLMEWMTHGGPQNDFDALLGSSTAPPEHYWYASHLSCKPELLRQQPFNEEFVGYGWEDLDVGRRLTESCTLDVLHDAVGLHHHAYTAADIFRRQWQAGRGLPQYQLLHPTSRLLPARSFAGRSKQQVLVRTGLHAALRHILQYTGRWLATPRLFSLAAATEFWRGVGAQRG